MLLTIRITTMVSWYLLNEVLLRNRIFAKYLLTRYLITKEQIVTLQRETNLGGHHKKSKLPSPVIRLDIIYPL